MAHRAGIWSCLTPSLSPQPQAHILSTVPKLSLLKPACAPMPPTFPGAAGGPGRAGLQVPPGWPTTLLRWHPSHKHPC